MEKHRNISKHLEILFPEYREFYNLTVLRLDTEEGFSETVEGHAAGHLCQAMLGSDSVNFSEEQRREDIIKYLEHIAAKKGKYIIKFFVDELKFPLPEGFTLDK